MRPNVRTFGALLAMGLFTAALLLTPQSAYAQENPANLETTAAIPRPERPTKANGSTPHLVEAGQTLASIAETYRVGVAQIVTLNRISPSQPLQAGQVLLIPLEPQVTAPPTEEREHIIRPGESLGSIANDYDTTIQALAKRNGIANPSIVRPGQKIIVPPDQPVRSMSKLPIGPDGYHRHSEFPTTTEKWIDVDLSEQRVVAYEGLKPANQFIISSGKGNTPTVTGKFRIRLKTDMQDMYGGDRASGDYYYLKDVKWVQYFYQDYGFHGTYWHNNFGTPMSRGCINMTDDDAKWLFDWAGPAWDDAGGNWQKPAGDNPGTLVIVHQ